MWILQIGCHKSSVIVASVSTCGFCFNVPPLWRDSKHRELLNTSNSCRRGSSLTSSAESNDAPFPHTSPPLSPSLIVPAPLSGPPAHRQRDQWGVGEKEGKMKGSGGESKRGKTKGWTQILSING